ncbi:putative isoprenylcysteine carboxyl methyltransferase [Rosellinia necatrix]|uniref:Putative isoprenylcysteine carboxyl methyltransferase n=1 Tax=Rosellinia necatrix TaxID=77044 RepID=A0A1S7UIK4_ROSNE|nr:putative isoprenylcysteine carboxyl methyltransferase [Rosellinia necatrix]
MILASAAEAYLAISPPTPTGSAAPPRQKPSTPSAGPGLRSRHTRKGRDVSSNSVLLHLGAYVAPGCLTTTVGLYRGGVQYPGYMGPVALVLICTDGALACWVPLRLYRRRAGVRRVDKGPPEERMLRARFSTEWKKWHMRTSRLVPWVLNVFRTSQSSW